MQGSEPGHLPAFRIDIDELRNAPRPGSSQTPWGNSSFSSDLQLSMFMETAEDYDYKTAKRRKVDADAFMKMTLLFTAYICAAFAVYVHYLRRDPQDNYVPTTSIASILSKPLDLYGGLLVSFAFTLNLTPVLAPMLGRSAGRNINVISITQSPWAGLQLPQAMTTFQTRVRTPSNSSAFSSPETSPASICSERELYGASSGDEEFV